MSISAAILTKGIAAVVGFGLGGLGAYNYMTTGCVTGMGCSGETAAVVETSVMEGGRCCSSTSSAEMLSDASGAKIVLATNVAGHADAHAEGEACGACESTEACDLCSAAEIAEASDCCGGSSCETEEAKAEVIASNGGE
ncbi:MAG: hypothetical protein AAGI17_04070 [Planctomycetota bacterium]